MKQVQGRVPDQDFEKLKEIAKRKGITISELIRRLLNKAIREKQYEEV